MICLNGFICGAKSPVCFWINVEHQDYCCNSGRTRGGCFNRLINCKLKMQMTEFNRQFAQMNALEINRLSIFLWIVLNETIYFYYFREIWLCIAATTCAAAEEPFLLSFSVTLCCNWTWKHAHFRLDGVSWIERGHERAWDSINSCYRSAMCECEMSDRRACVRVEHACRCLQSQSRGLSMYSCIHCSYAIVDAHMRVRKITRSKLAGRAANVFCILSSYCMNHPVWCVVFVVSLLHTRRSQYLWIAKQFEQNYSKNSHRVALIE